MDAFRRLSISNVIRPNGSRAVQVTWALNTAFRSPGPYSFELWRGHAPGDDQATLLATAGDGHWMYDESPQFPQMGTGVYYQVVLIDADGVRHDSAWQPYNSYWARRDWRLARDIVRAEASTMQKYTGALGWLLKRRYWGAPCTVCMDPVTFQVNDPDCDVCYGTRFSEGYHDPLECWVVVEQGGKLSKLDDNTGHQKANQFNFRVLAYPPMESGDIWVQAHTDQRYRVQGQAGTLAIYRGIPLVYQMQGIELPRSDSVYNIPVGVPDAAL